jgi:hypothetical protein
VRTVADRQRPAHIPSAEPVCPTGAILTVLQKSHRFARGGNIYVPEPASDDEPDSDSTRLSTAPGRFVLSSERQLLSGLESTALRSQNDIREGPSFARKLYSVHATKTTKNKQFKRLGLVDLHRLRWADPWDFLVAALHQHPSVIGSQKKCGFEVR